MNRATSCGAILSPRFATVSRAAKTPAQTAAVARRFARVLPPPPMHLHLCGDLGAGKTLWTRALIAALGGGARVPSPSFALALSYPSPRMLIHHLDLFRLPQGAPLPGELSELLQENALCLVEWPGRASDLPSSDIRITMDFYCEENESENGSESCGEDGRVLTFAAESEKGEECLRAFGC